MSAAQAGRAGDRTRWPPRHIPVAVGLVSAWPGGEFVVRVGRLQAIRPLQFFRETSRSMASVASWGGGSSEGASPFVRGAYFVVGGDLLLDLVRRMVRECVGAVDGVAYLVLVAAVSA